MKAVMVTIRVITMSQLPGVCGSNDPVTLNIYHC